MNGVRIPDVSAGSNQVGASEMCTAQVTWPAGASARAAGGATKADRKSTRLNSSHRCISYAVFCLKKKEPSELRGDDQSPHAHSGRHHRSSVIAGEHAGHPVHAAAARAGENEPTSRLPTASPQIRT